jgi:ribosomal protein S18 acetylase RimI-like enzyme
MPSEVAKIALISRLAKAVDLPAIEELVNLAYRGGMATVSWKNENHLVKGPRTTKADLEKIFANEQEWLIVAESEPAEGKAVGSIIGCVLVQEAGEKMAEIGMLSVHPHYQDIGAGRFLLEAAEEYSRSQLQAKLAKMYVVSGRPQLLDWYERRGFTKTGELLPFFGPESGVVPLVDGTHLIVVSKQL